MIVNKWGRKTTTKTPSPPTYLSSRCLAINAQFDSLNLAYNFWFIYLAQRTFLIFKFWIYLCLYILPLVSVVHDQILFTFSVCEMNDKPQLLTKWQNEISMKRVWLIFVWFCILIKWYISSNMNGWHDWRRENKQNETNEFGVDIYNSYYICIDRVIQTHGDRKRMHPFIWHTQLPIIITQQRTFECRPKWEW